MIWKATRAMKAGDDAELWAIQDVAAHFNVVPATVYRWIKNGIVPRPPTRWVGTQERFAFTGDWVKVAEDAIGRS